MRALVIFLSWGIWISVLKKKKAFKQRAAPVTFTLNQKLWIPLKKSMIWWQDDKYYRVTRNTWKKSLDV
jgi:hypothetical protein